MKTISLLVDIIATGIECYMCYLFCSTFVNSNFFDKNKIRFICATIFGVLIIQLLGVVSVFGVVKSIFSIFFCFYLLQILAYRKYYVKCLVFTLIYTVFFSLIDFSVVGMSSVISSMPMDTFQSVSFYRMIGTAISKTLLILLVFSINKFVNNKNINKRYIVLIFLLSGSVLLMSFVVFQRFLILNQIQVTDIIIFVSLLCLSLITFFYILKISEMFEEKEERLLLNIHNEMLNESLKEQKRSFDVWSSKIHDYKNHLLYMTELSDNNEFEKLSNYLHQEVGEVKRTTSIVKTGYIGIDAIINSKQIYAKSVNVHMFCNINLPANLTLDEYKLSIILGNLIDNAIRAAETVENSTLEVAIYMIQNNLCIKICNPVNDNKIDFSKSTKNDKEIHGIGLKSVKNCAEELNGEFSIEVKNNVVTAFVTLFNVK